MKRKISGMGTKLVAILFCGFMFMSAWENRAITINQWMAYQEGEINFTTFVDNVSSKMISELKDKNQFINLNGMFIRCLGQTENNQILRLNNGMLTASSWEKMDMEPKAENISELSNYLEERNIEFLYVQAPVKMDLEKTLLPVGKEHYANENADQLLECLASAQVETLDLRPHTSASVEMVEEFFYKTDHHWNAKGGFIAYQKITEYVKELFPMEAINEDFLDQNQWEVHVKEECFLGSRGKRVGIYFGGVDDLIWFTPRFETEMSCAIPYQSMFYKGDFVEANIRSKWYESTEPNYFIDNQYCVYIGSDYPLVQHRNISAPNNTKLLVIKDSFMSPTQSFLSTQFKEVDVIDLRLFKAETLTQYIDDTAPDMVIMMLFPGSFSNDVQFVYNLEKQKTNEALRWKDIVEKDKLSINEYQDGSVTCLLEKLVPGETYEICVDVARISGARGDCLTMAVYDVTSKSKVQLRCFDVEYCNANEGYKWKFEIPETNRNLLKLIVYPGTGGEEKETEKEVLWNIELKGVSVRRTCQEF